MNSKNKKNLACVKFSFGNLQFTAFEHFAVIATPAKAEYKIKGNAQPVTHKLERHQNKACSAHRFHYQAKIYPDNTSVVFDSSTF